MKKGVMLIATLAAMANANAEGSFEVSVGNGHINTDCSGTTKCSDSSTGLKLVGSVNLSPNVAIEGMFINYGKAYGRFLYFGYPAGADARVTGVGAGAAYAWSFGPGFKLIGRGGVALNRSKYTEFVASEHYENTESQLQPYVGAQISYQVTDSTSVVAGADFSRANIDGSHVSVRLLSLGLKWGL